MKTHLSKAHVNSGEWLISVDLSNKYNFLTFLLMCSCLIVGYLMANNMIIIDRDVR